MAAASSVSSTFTAASGMATAAINALINDKSVVKRKADRCYFHIPAGPFKSAEEYHKEKEAAIRKGAPAVDAFLQKAHGSAPIYVSVPPVGGSKAYLKLLGFDATTKLPLKRWLFEPEDVKHALHCDAAFNDSFTSFRYNGRPTKLQEYNLGVLRIIADAMLFQDGGYIYCSKDASANLVSLFELQYHPSLTMKDVRASINAAAIGSPTNIVGGKIASVLLPGPIIVSLPIGALGEYLEFYSRSPVDIGYPLIINEGGPTEDVPHSFPLCDLNYRKTPTGIRLGLEPCSPPTPVSSDPIPNVVEEDEPSRAELAALAEAALLAEVEAEEAAARAPKPSKKKKSKASAPAPIVGGGAASPSVPMNVVEVYEPPAPAPAPVVPAPAPAPYVNYNVVEVYEPPPPVVNYNVVEVLYEDEDPTNV